jgi:hypothetical protein
VPPQGPLSEKYGRKANMMKWKEQLNGDCPNRDAHGMHERCDLICPRSAQRSLIDGLRSGPRREGDDLDRGPSVPGLWGAIGGNAADIIKQRGAELR